MRMAPRTMRKGGKKTCRRKEKAAAVVNILSQEFDQTFSFDSEKQRRERKKIITNDLTRVKKITPGQRFKAFQVLDNSFEEERLFILLNPELLGNHFLA